MTLSDSQVCSTFAIMISIFSLGSNHMQSLSMHSYISHYELYSYFIIRYNTHTLTLSKLHYTKGRPLEYHDRKPNYVVSVNSTIYHVSLMKSIHKSKPTPTSIEDLGTSKLLYGFFFLSFSHSWNLWNVLCTQQKKCIG